MRVQRTQQARSRCPSQANGPHHIRALRRPCLRVLASQSEPGQQEQQQQAPAAGAPPAAVRRPAPGPRGPPVMLGSDGKPLQVVQVEKAGDEAWGGVAAVDRGEGTDLGKVAQLVLGDLAALLLFAAVGRNNHGEALSAETITTALPFIIGWIVSASLLDGYGQNATAGRVGPAAATAAKCWALGTPLGLVLRGASKGYVPPTPFIIVSLVATAVLLVGWRSGYAAVTPEAKPGVRKDKKGNPFEFLSLLSGLTTRW